ncbi:MAG: ribose ABC transporter permease [Flavobacteriaceae bacterium]|nr:MAG: ribose ABC transporter permease [Flavobacteriaceae bacterium]
MTRFQKAIQLLLNYSTVVLFLVVLVTFGLLSPKFLTLGNITNILIQSSSLTILAIGMTFVLLTAGIDLSVGSIMFVVGVISGKLVVIGLPIWWAIPLVLVIGLLFGLVNAFFIFKLKIVPFIVTLATFYVGRGLGLYISETRAINLPESFLQIGSSKLLGLPMPIVILLLVLIIGHFVLSSTQFGRQVYAVGNDMAKARKAGVPVKKILLTVYLICGLCAAISSLVALAQLGAVSPTFGYQNEFMAIAAAVLGGTSLFGGKGNILPGTLIGALLIQSIQNGLVIINVNPYIYPVITGTVIFLIVMIDSLRHKSVQKALRTKTTI